MVGSAICRELRLNDDVNLITRNREELDLLNQVDVDSFFKSEQPHEVILCAAKVGGIYANSSYPAEFIYQNLQIQNNVIHSAHQHNVQKLLCLVSSCIYPKLAAQPLKENSLLGGFLESTNEAYAIAKIAGVKLCESYNRQYGRDYRSVMPTNLYGPGDNYNLKDSHVVPALIRRLHDAKIGNSEKVTIWGSGNQMREFLYVDDMASACVFIHNLPYNLYKDHTSPMVSHINIGTGEDLSIRELAETISNIIGFEGDLCFDKTKPDGTPKKLLDVSLLNNLGWKSKISLVEGLKFSYGDFLKNNSNLRM